MSGGQHYAMSRDSVLVVHSVHCAALSFAKPVFSIQDTSLPAGSFKLADTLTSRLSDLNSDLSSMITEINGVSNTLSQSNKAKSDDPFETIVKVLNSHVNHIREIERSNEELRLKVEGAKKEMAGMNRGLGGYGHNGGEDDFWKSYMRS
jgi:nuclear pore complex protein Nup62